MFYSRNGVLVDIKPGNEDYVSWINIRSKENVLCYSLLVFILHNPIVTFKNPVKEAFENIVGKEENARDKIVFYTLPEVHKMLSKSAV